VLAKRLVGRGWFAACCIVLMLLGTRSMLQSRHWRGDIPLFSHALDVNPRSFMAANNLGYVYLGLENFERAEPLFRMAIQHNNDYPDARENLAVVLGRTNRAREAVEQRMIALHQRMARPEPARGDLLRVLCGLARDLIASGNPDEARGYLDLARKLSPDDEEVAELTKTLSS
jgi:Flp pilus assembly protein TadD